MDKTTRNSIQHATQAARGLLEDAYREQLEGTFDILLDGTISEQPGSHLTERQKVTREKLVAAIGHKRSTGLTAKEAVDAYLREAAFTTLNRFVALKMLEARQLVQECVSKGEDSSGFNEFTALASGLVAVDDKGYRLYIETLFDEIGQEVKVLFDRRDVASLLWPERQTLHDLLAILNAPELANIWAEDETIGWVYQYFNGDEERTQMRKESQAPRNSRELAVRNQFFTPRYVVQFLSDNTLGRTWYEMMQGDTQLAHLDYLVRRPNEVFLAEGESAPESDTDDSELSQEELLQQTVHVPLRAKKDPRDLRVLDPACGSGHFLLYTFDLLITIYEEAWADAGAAAFTETGSQLRADYESLEDLRRAMPELNLRHNLHGVDIDPRAAQIAALALWMRAQRAYNQFEVDRAQRPPITKTNIVVAEPMPGEAELVDEFAASLKPAVLGDLFKKMVEEMKLAGELGSLLKIEESIAKAVKEAAEANQQGNLFVGQVESQEFWDTADEKIIAALGSFAESAAGAGGVRRQLFAGDAAQGVAFIELMRKRFDAVLMNPPFGAGSLRAKRQFESVYAQTKNDIYAAFVERCIDMLEQAGRLGAITSRTGFFLSSFRHWRKAVLLKHAPPEICADLGAGVLDKAAVETAAYCLRKGEGTSAHFIRLVEAVNKGNSLRTEVRAASGRSYRLFPRDFLAIPGAPFAYWTTSMVRRLFLIQPRFESHGLLVRVSNETGDDFRFMRLRWETPTRHEGCAWIPHAKGGTQSDYYHDLHLCIRWNQARRTVLGYVGRPNRPDEALANADLFLRPGLTYPRRTNGLSVRVLPAGATFSNKGPAILHNDDSDAALLAACALVNSAPFRALVAVQLARTELAQSFEVGLIRGTPALTLSTEQELELAELCRSAWANRRLVDTVCETSHAFVLPAVLQFGGGSVSSRITAWEVNRRHLDTELACGRAKIDELCLTYYGATQTGRRRVQEGLAAFAHCNENEDPDSSPAPVFDAKQGRLAMALLAWCVGVVTGRFDVRLTAEGRRLESAPQPFDPLPMCSPAMLASDDGRPPAVVPSDYPLSIPADGTFVDDPGHAVDLASRSQAVFTQVFDEPDARWQEAAELVGARNQDLRLWFAKDFFAYHIRQYSKSRRKAPIYWQLATPSASYSVWCYYHRLTRDTFFRVANDYVTPKVGHEERKLNTLRQEAGPDPSGKQRKEINAQETFVAELRAFLAEVKRIAPLWNPNLNDGVIINFAPLWRLVPQHKAWQKECKKVWDKLCKGDYDWAHLAMHLWPERVMPKCQDDRSLAIAHGLEDDFWYEDDDEKWQKRQISNDRVEELVAERASTAVKAALNDLLEVTDPIGKPRRKRRVKT